MTSVLTKLVARALLLPTLVVAAALIVKGYADVGDGFAAGVVAALGILLQYLAFGYDEVRRALPVHLAPGVALAGLSLAVAVVLVPVFLGGAPLEHWPAAGDEVDARPVAHLVELALEDRPRPRLGVGGLLDRHDLREVTAAHRFDGDARERLGALEEAVEDAHDRVARLVAQLICASGSRR